MNTRQILARAAAEHHAGEDRPEEVLRDALAALRDAGIDTGAVLPATPEGAVLVAEAVNRAAKALDPGFYARKPAVWAAAARIAGVAAGWAPDGCFHLRAEGVGTACAHDPTGELWDATRGGPRVDWVWSGVTRQEFGLLALADATVRWILAEATTPGGCLDGADNARVGRLIRRATRR